MDANELAARPWRDREGCGAGRGRRLVSAPGPGALSRSPGPGLGQDLTQGDDHLILFSFRHFRIQGQDNAAVLQVFAYR